MEDALLDPESRLTVLRRAARSLLSATAIDEAAQRLANLVVPDFADWCAVDRATGPRAWERVAVAHADPQKVRLALELEERYPPDPEQDRGVPHVLATGQAELGEEITDELLVQSAHDEEHLRILRELGLASYAVLPIALEGEVAGALTVVQSESKRRLTEQHLPALEDLATLAALAMKNAALAEARTKALGEANEQARRLRQVVDNLPDLAWTAEADGTIDYYSPRWAEYLGAHPAELQKRGWDGAMEPQHLEALRASWQSALAHGEPFELELQMRGADGTPRWFRCRAAPLADDDGEVERWFGITADIDELKRVAALMEAVKAQSDEAARLIERLRAERDEAREALASRQREET